MIRRGFWLGKRFAEWVFGENVKARRLELCSNAHLCFAGMVHRLIILELFELLYIPTRSKLSLFLRNPLGTCGALRSISPETVRTQTAEKYPIAAAREAHQKGRFFVAPSGLDPQVRAALLGSSARFLSQLLRRCGRIQAYRCSLHLRDSRSKAQSSRSGKAASWIGCEISQVCKLQV